MEPRAYHLHESFGENQRRSVKWFQTFIRSISEEDRKLFVHFHNYCPKFFLLSLFSCSAWLSLPQALPPSPSTADTTITIASPSTLTLDQTRIRSLSLIHASVAWKFLCILLTLSSAASSSPQFGTVQKGLQCPNSHRPTKALEKEMRTEVTKLLSGPLND